MPRRNDKFLPHDWDRAKVPAQGTHARPENIIENAIAEID